MRKILLLIICAFLVSGCSLGNTPTSLVEEYLSSYQRVDDDVSLSYEQLSFDEDIDGKYRDDYQKLIERQYKNLSYEIKEEVIDGRSADVSVEVEVYDYNEIFEKYDKDEYDRDRYDEMIINELVNQKDRITYTMMFSLTMNEDDEWELLELSLDNRGKLLGIK